MGKLGIPPDLDSGERRFESYYLDGVVGVMATHLIVDQESRDRYPYNTPIKQRHPLHCGAAVCGRG